MGFVLYTRCNQQCARQRLIMAQKTCFVIIGFGPKVDYETGRTLDLDKTFENLIKPVFDGLNIKCFRANGIRHTGVIDELMYEWIFKADIVVADISTLNPNALYELGVRHALRPNSTIVISEDKLKYPFDVNHIVIEKYEHLGKDIGVSEAKRFKRELKAKVETILKSKKRDSPIYIYLPELNPPGFQKKKLKKLKKGKSIEPTASELLKDAEKEKNESNFKIAIELYKVCLRFEPNNSFLVQRLALVTYKSESPNPKDALLKAESILKKLNPFETTDPETLGLSGAINKRLYELTNDKLYLDRSLWFYEKGFYILQDYYNGINYAYLLTVKSVVERKKYSAISFYVQANRVREQIVSICQSLIKQNTFKDRGDKEWIYQSLAQAYLGLNNKKELRKIIPKITKLSKGKFDMATFNEQNTKLIDFVTTFKLRHPNV